MLAGACFGRMFIPSMAQRQGMAVKRAVKGTIEHRGAPGDPAWGPGQL